MNKELKEALKIRDKEKEEADKARYAESMSFLIMALKSMAKKYQLSPIEVVGIFKLVEETVLSGGSNIEVAIMLKDLKESGLLPSRGSPNDPKEGKDEGYL